VKPGIGPDACFTLTVYGHLFESDLDALGDRLEAFAARNERGMEAPNEPLAQRLVGLRPGETLRGPGWDRTIDRGIMSPLL
jgi:hypothetical protein